MNVKTLKALLLLEFFLWIQNGLLGQTDSGPSRYDILISEIMAKPAPQTGLPAVEYIELHNRLPHPVNLQNWQLKLGNTVKKLPDIALDSNGYAVIIAQKHQEEFAPFCDHLVTLSSLSVTDGGQTLTLSDKDGKVIHHVNFRRSWHTEAIKQEGGWSLEMIDTGWPCAGEWNWDSSTDPSGGTPGRPNSIRNTLNSNILPTISGVTMIDSLTLRVHWSQTVDQSITQDVSVFQTSPSLDILAIKETAPEFSSVDLLFSAPVKPRISYRLTCRGNILDCGGNSHPTEEEIPFGIACPPGENDLVINEILTNPLDGSGADYLEIHNRSGHIIDMKEVKVGYGGDTLPQKAVVAVSKGWQLHPEEYVALCRQRAVTLEQYVCKDERRLIQCDSLPDFAISQGVVHLTDKSLRRIDRLAYDENMHYSKLLTSKGVALERLYPDRPTQEESNWRSAAESAGYGTPGYRNSQAGCAESEAEFAVLPEVISPDNDGSEDYAEVICRFPEEENRVSIVVYNSRGHPVKHLANNVLCGNESFFRWEGDDNNGAPAPAGMYVMQIESWNLRTGKTLRKRKVVSIYR